MGRERERKRGRSRRERRRRSTRTDWTGTLGLAALGVFAIGLIAGTILTTRRPTLKADRSPDLSGPVAMPQPQSDGNLTDSALNAAVNQLFLSLNPSLADNQYFPQFAQEKIGWILSQKKAGTLRIIFLENTENTGLDAEDLMASGTVEGKSTIVIARPRFIGFLLEGGRTSAPFTLQERNDFALALVHEVVHLQNPNRGDPARLGDRMAEELRAWRETDLNFARQLRELNQPMNYRVIEADDALRACGDKLPCEPLRQMLLPTEIRK